MASYRHGHLMLFDDEEQIEVRHVISLAHHNVSIYSGGDVTPEGELWIKRNALCLSRRTEGNEKVEGQVSKPFYLFSENCSAKEDFYFALLKSQEQTFGESGRAPTPKQFDVKNIITLVQKLHSTEDNPHTRWLNALLGRIFLAVYETKDLETYINEKITKKIARVKKPSFLTNINIQNINTGEGAPFFSNMKLKELNVEGETCVEADVRYTGNFRIEVAATAKIDLGPRFKAREVNLVLAVVLKKIEGHVYFRIKPPPSNRVWVSFEKMPKMEMAIEPIVSSRQITYTVILRQIENRIKEVFAETLVQPFWDDIPFFKTEHKKWRGGIFSGDDTVEDDVNNLESAIAQTGDVESVDRLDETPDLLAETRPMEKSHSMPATAEAAATGLFGRKLKVPASPASPASPAPSAASAASATSTGVETKAASSGAPSPRTLHTAPEPIVGTDAAHADLFKPSTSPPDHASSFMAALHSRSQDASPIGAPVGSPGKMGQSLKQKPSTTSLSSAGREVDKENETETDASSLNSGRRNTVSSTDSGLMKENDGAEPQSPALSIASFKDQAGSLGRSFFARHDTHGSLASHQSDGNGSSQKKNTLAAVTTAAAQARQWGWNAIQRQKDARKTSDAANHPVDLSQPMGRGQPLPPPGTPLPRPTNGKTKIGPPAVPHRKPVPSSSSSPERPANEHSSEENLSQQPPLLPARRRRGESYDHGNDNDGQGMLVVAAPIDESEPSTPDIYPKPDFLAASGRASLSTTDTTLTTNDATSFKSTPEPTQASTPPEEAVRAGSPTVGDTSSQPTGRAKPNKIESNANQTSNFDNNLSVKPDNQIVATPAAGATTPPDNDDDDYSGWLEDEDANTQNTALGSTDKTKKNDNAPIAA